MLLRLLLVMVVHGMHQLLLLLVGMMQLLLLMVMMVPLMVVLLLHGRLVLHVRRAGRPDHPAGPRDGIGHLLHGMDGPPLVAAAHVPWHGPHRRDGVALLLWVAYGVLYDSLA